MDSASVNFKTFVDVFVRFGLYGVPMHISLYITVSCLCQSPKSSRKLLPKPLNFCIFYVRNCRQNVNKRGIPPGFLVSRISKTSNPSRTIQNHLIPLLWYFITSLTVSFNCFDLNSEGGVKIFRRKKKSCPRPATCYRNLLPGTCRPTMHHQNGGAE